MFRYILLLFIVVFTLSCDDGDLKVSNFNFDTASIQFCNNVLYKINKEEMVLLDIPATTFVNAVTPENAPILLNINGTNRLIYRLYNTTQTAASFCTTIPPANIAVADEWIAQQGVDKLSGLIQIKTTEIKDATTAAVTGYNHEIRFLNVIFTNANSNFVFENYLFGNYVTNL